MKRPYPIPDAVSFPYWEAARQNVLTVATCSVCGAASVAPDATCPACLSTRPDFFFAPTEGRGVIRSWTVVHRSFLPGLNDLVPFALVDVELDGHPDVRTIGRLLDWPTESLRLGAAVKVAFEHLSPEISIPAFTTVAP